MWLFKGWSALILTFWKSASTALMQQSNNAHKYSHLSSTYLWKHMLYWMGDIQHIVGSFLPPSLNFMCSQISAFVVNIFVKTHAFLNGWHVVGLDILSKGHQHHSSVWTLNRTTQASLMEDQLSIFRSSCSFLPSFLPSTCSQWFKATLSFHPPNVRLGSDIK